MVAAFIGSQYIFIERGARHVAPGAACGESGGGWTWLRSREGHASTAGRARLYRRMFLPRETGQMTGFLNGVSVSPLIEEHRDTSFELSVTRSHDGG